MISIIICSANKRLLTDVSSSIHNTIGVDYEIIAFENGNGENGICELYNLGFQKAKYNLICYMHEDILIQTQNWGKTVADIFATQPNLGMLGVAGSYYKPLTPSGWLGKGIDTECSNLCQGKKSGIATHLHYKNPFGGRLANVACLDGLWFCVPRSINEQFKFDEETFKGFHGYDLDFSVQVGQHYRLAVTYDILLTHYSTGNFDKVWLLEALKFQKKWSSILPVNRNAALSSKQLTYIEKVTFKFFLSQLKAFALPLSIAFKVLWQYSFYRKAGFILFIKLNYYAAKAAFSAAKYND